MQLCFCSAARKWHTKAASIKRNLNLPFPLSFQQNRGTLSLFSSQQRYSLAWVVIQNQQASGLSLLLQSRRMQSMSFGTAGFISYFQDESHIWDHGTLAPQNNTCMICGRNVSRTKTSSTSTLRFHKEFTSLVAAANFWPSRTSPSFSRIVAILKCVIKKRGGSIELECMNVGCLPQFPMS